MRREFLEQSKPNLSSGLSQADQNEWPISLNQINATFLRGLTDFEFHKLQKRFYNRSLQHSGSRKHAHNVARKLKNIREPYDAPTLKNRKLLLAKQKPSDILDGLCPDRWKKWIDPGQRNLSTEIDLKQFSLIDNPVGTMNDLEKIVIAEAVAADTRLNFVDDDLIDIAPYLIWGLMRKDMAPFMSGGQIKDPIRQVMDAVDLRGFLGIGRFAKPLESKRNLFAFPLRQRRRGGSSTDEELSSASTKEKVADEFVATVNNWLGQLASPRQLTPDSAVRSRKIIGEVLDNAERHSRVEGDGDWSIAGFMVQRPHQSGGPNLTCHLAVISVGETIAESMSKADAKTLADLNTYTARQGKGKNGTEEMATIFALQDGISRVPQGPGLSIGGVGMMDIVQYANELGGVLPGSDGPSPQVTILSGNTLIQFKTPYATGVLRDGDGRRFQWFNPTNWLDSPADRGHVFSIRQRFPGTVTAARFVLDQAFLEGGGGGRHGAD